MISLIRSRLFELNSMQVQHCFNACFGKKYRVEMRGGADEPEYIPPRTDQTGKLIYRSDYASSALHEAAHWCIAGPARRARVDFGYEYSPPPRTPLEQDQFFRFERRVQALEWIFSDCAQVIFHPSADNLEVDTDQFLGQLELAKEQELHRLECQVHSRASVFKRTLMKGVCCPSQNINESRGING